MLIQERICSLFTLREVSIFEKGCIRRESLLDPAVFSLMCITFSVFWLRYCMYHLSLPLHEYVLYHVYQFTNKVSVTSFVPGETV